MMAVGWAANLRHRVPSNWVFIRPYSRVFEQIEVRHMISFFVP